MSWLDEPVATIAFLWRIERRDGVTLGFTSHDRDLVADGLVHRAAPGMVPAAVETRDDLEPAGSEVAGVLSADAIGAEDLSVGRWDGAAVTLSACDWTAPARRIPLSRGTLGAVEAGRGAFSAALRGAAAAFDRPVVERTSPDCRAALGDRRCRVAMAGRRVRAVVVDAREDGLRLDRAEPVADGWGWGRLRWLDGANAGLSAIVHSSDGARVRLTAAPRFAVTPGVAVEMIEGCDRRFETCRDRFRNAANFQGEPHLPGMDLLTRYPGG